MTGSGQATGDPESETPTVVFDGWEPPAVGSVFEVTLPAQADLLDVVRTATAGLAARLSFSLDDIEDLRSAVNEACDMVLALPGPQTGEAATLTCRFDVLAGALAVRVSAPVSENADLPVRHSFGWHVLTTHATGVGGGVEAGHAWIELRKIRP